MKQLFLFDQDDSHAHVSTTTIWKLSVDGASRGNPGPAGAGIYLQKNGEPLLSKGFFLGVKTNNQAEYMALLLGLYFLEPLVTSEDTIHIYSDSQLLIKQLKGEYKIKDVNLRILYGHAVAFLRSKHHVLFHVLRHINSVADALANQGIDKKVKVPDDFTNFCERYR